MEKVPVVLRVVGETSAESNLLANTLIDELKANIRGIKLDRQKEDPDTLDPGTVIVALVGTQFALELAKTLHAWLLRNHNATLTFGTQGELAVTGVSADSIESIVKAKLGGAAAES